LTAVRLLVAIAVITVSCAPFNTSTPASAQSYPMYQYVVQVPTKPVSPNERLKLAWEPRLASGSSTTIYEIQLCVALFGPWESVDALKKAMAPRDTRSCPPVGASVVSETERVASNIGARMATEVIVPSAPGFYDLRQISILSAGNSTSSASIIEVR
jgi:hypothetical protein